MQNPQIVPRLEEDTSDTVILVNGVGARKIPHIQRAAVRFHAGVHTAAQMVIGKCYDE